MTWADQTLVGQPLLEDQRRRGTWPVPAGRGEGRRGQTRFPARSRRCRPRRLAARPSAIEVPVGADAETIQRAIDEAAKLAGQRPVVHLPMGNYPVAQTLVIPAAATSNSSATAPAKPAPASTGPGRRTALFSGSGVPAMRPCAISTSTPARPGRCWSRIATSRKAASSPTNSTSVDPAPPGGTNSAALRISGLEQTDVLLRALQGSGNGGRWVEVLGGPNAERATNQVSIFTGATGSAAGQYDVRQGGRLVVRSVYHERSSDSLNGLHLADRGTLSIDATRFSYATSPASPTVAADNFRGLFTLATCMLLPVETKASCRFELRGDGSGASVLALNDQFWIEQKTTADDVWRNLAQPPARGGLLGCNVNTAKKGGRARGLRAPGEPGRAPRPGQVRFWRRPARQPRHGGRCHAPAPPGPLASRAGLAAGRGRSRQRHGPPHSSCDGQWRRRRGGGIPRFAVTFCFTWCGEMNPAGHGGRPTGL